MRRELGHRDRPIGHVAFPARQHGSAPNRAESPQGQGSFEAYTLARQAKMLHGVAIRIIRAKDALLGDAGDGGVHAFLEPLDILGRPTIGSGLAESLDQPRPLRLKLDAGIQHADRPATLQQSRRARHGGWT